MISVTAVTLCFLPFSGSGQGPGVVSQTAYFGPLRPGSAGAPSSVTLNFQIPVSDALAVRGYQVTAVSNFAFTAESATVGKSITAADIGIGVVGVSSVDGLTGNATITSGFDQDPSQVRGNAKNGFYGGAASGRATLADLAGGRQIVRVDKMPKGSFAAGKANVTLIVKLGVPMQYFTPGTFSGSLLLYVQ